MTLIRDVNHSPAQQLIYSLVPHILLATCSPSAPCNFCSPSSLHHPATFFSSVLLIGIRISISTFKVVYCTQLHPDSSPVIAKKLQLRSSNVSYFLSFTSRFSFYLCSPLSYNSFNPTVIDGYQYRPLASRNGSVENCFSYHPPFFFLLSRSLPPLRSSIARCVQRVADSTLPCRSTFTPTIGIPFFSFHQWDRRVHAAGLPLQGCLQFS